MLEALSASARPRCRDRVGRDQEHRLDGLWLDLVVVRLDRVDDAVRLAVAARELGGDGACEPSTSCVIAFPMSCSSAARFAVFTEAPSSAAMIPARCTTSSVCLRTFWP